MKKAALLVSENLVPGSTEQSAFSHEHQEQIAKLVPAFADHGMVLEEVKWREAPDIASEYDVMLTLFVWDYFDNNERDFLEAMAKIEGQTLLVNNFKILKWNLNKSYLDDMEALGAATIPTVKVERVSENNIIKALEEFSTDRLVIKPDVGAAAWRQVLYKKGEPMPDRDAMPPNGALIQPYLKSVETEGEFSFLYFGNGFSHALRKRPKAGDYRVQALHGGREEPYEPTKEDREQARNILDVLDFTPVYARVDLIRGNDGRLLLIELEMIEPYLYLPYAEGEGGDNKGAQKLAKAVAKKLTE